MRFDRFDRFNKLKALRLSKGIAHHPEPVEGKEVPEALSDRDGECANIISPQSDTVKETSRTTLCDGQRSPRGIAPRPRLKLSHHDVIPRGELTSGHRLLYKTDSRLMNSVTSGLVFRTAKNWMSH